METLVNPADLTFDLALPSPVQAPPSKRLPLHGDDDAGSITVNTSAPPAPTPPTQQQHPPPKTDKPRPHLCTTCDRAFARLEHLKRHERSHTKEKPFECGYCTRCFARRDLLLRHQQKLHQNLTPPARPRNRRQSSSALPASSRQRKNSTVSISSSAAPASTTVDDLRSLTAPSTGLQQVHGLGLSTMDCMSDVHGLDNLAGIPGVHPGANTARPRANTISHFDIMAPTAASPANLPTLHSRHPSLSGFSMHGMDQMSLQSSAFAPRSALGLRGISNGLSKLETHAINSLDYPDALRTASMSSHFSADLDIGLDTPGAGNTINPNALHYPGPAQCMAFSPTSAFGHGSGSFNDVNVPRNGLDWLIEHQTCSGSAIDDSAIEASTPSTDSVTDMGDIMLDGSKQTNRAGATTHGLRTADIFNNPLTFPSLSQHAQNSLFGLDMPSTSFSDLLAGSISPIATTVPQSATDAAGTSTSNADIAFSTPPPSLSSMSPSLLATMNAAVLSQPFGSSNGVGAAPETPNSTNGTKANMTLASETCSLSSTITEATRSAIVNALNAAASQSTTFGMRTYLFNKGTAPSATHTLSASISVPSTSELQRYVDAYLAYFQPHYPFLHTATMSFDVTPSPPTLHNSPENRTTSPNPTVEGHGCLILSMAAIGALYELEHEQSRALFTMAKRMLQLYLDERRKANVRRVDFRRTPTGDVAAIPSQAQADSSADTPVWLVQAMLLNVVYGHNSSDKRAGEIATTHGAALVSLAQGADLLRSERVEPLPDELDLLMGDGIDPANLWSINNSAANQFAKDEQLWRRWRTMEERKRTLYAIFVLSSSLVASYNHPPALTNSEILLDLPCDEEFFAAPTCADFMALGGVAAANHNRMSFHEVLGKLLRASERQMKQNDDMLGSMSSGKDAFSDLRPSTFGSFVLINALQNYIWETRQRHHNKVWTNEETEKMHRYIEPALQAWQRAWASNPYHTKERPNPYGLGPLAADSLPLLNLAYVRLFVNLAPSKEFFWQRNWDGLAEELSHEADTVQNVEQSPGSNAESAMTDPSSDLSGNASSVFAETPATQLSSSPDIGSSRMDKLASAHPPPQSNSSRATSRREKHLRKAAYYAADALSDTDSTGLTIADFSKRELPLQAAQSALDCAQVLAEWVATLQDRVGRYLGILGHDDVDLGQVPAIMLLEEEDVRLLGKIQAFLVSAEMLMTIELASGTSTGSVNGVCTRMASRLQMGEQIGYAAKILSVTAYLLGKAAVWPVTHLMAECLENHAGHMRVRAQRSVMAGH